MTKNDARVLSADDFCEWFCWQQSGYGDAGGMYPFQATGSGAGAYYMINFRSTCIIFWILIVELILIRFSFSMLQLHMARYASLVLES